MKTMIPVQSPRIPRIPRALVALLAATALQLALPCPPTRADVGRPQAFEAPSKQVEAHRLDQGAAAKQLEVHVDGGRLTVALHTASLADVLAAVARASGISVTLDAPVNEPVTMSFAALPLDEGLRRILGSRSFVFLYGGNPGAEPTPTTPRGAIAPRLASLRVFETPGAADQVPGHAPTEYPGPADVQETLATSPSSDFPGSSAKDSAAVIPLARELLEETDGERRASAATKLGRTWSPDAVDPLGQAALDDEDASVRLAAVEALGRSWDENAIDALALALLDDPDATVREQAAHALGETWSDAAVEPLTEALLDDPQWQVRERAARALGEAGGAEAIPSLAKALQDDDGSVRESAAMALAAIGDPRAQQILARAGISVAQ